MTRMHAYLAVIAGLMAATVTAANASPYNYVFPGGSFGFVLSSEGGFVNPGVLVGFNPQPEPPAFPTTISLADPFNPVLVSPGPCTPSGVCSLGHQSYNLVMSFTGIGSGSLNPPPEPDRDGRTTLNFTSADGLHSFVLALAVTGPTSISDWVGFNPQPDPPASWFGVRVGFGASLDPDVQFSLTEDGHALRFHLVATPLPAALPLFGTGLGLLGLVARRGRRKPLAL